MREIIENFISSDIESIPLQTFPLDTYMQILEDNGYEREDLEDNTNGFSIDFWYYFKKDSSRLCLAGSLWYGDYSLSKEKDDE